MSDRNGKIELWFFRDLVDAQRMQLFRLFGLPIDQLGALHAQKRVIDNILNAEIRGLKDELDETGRTADARKVIIEQRDARIAALEAENERLRKALKGCKTHIAGFHLRDLDQAPEVLSEFNSELQRIHRIACAALEAKP